MALVFVPRYELRFDTDRGSDITWEVNILRSYDDVDPVPSWVSDPVRPLIGTSDPITIEYLRDRDVYKPIQGSKADLNLVVTEAGQYEDFNTGNPYEWQLRLRYEDSNGDMQDYWCGFFNPVDSKETVNTFPFTRSFTAVDGLGQLEQRSIPQTDRPTADTPVSIFSNVIVDALEQTGLALDIYVDSGIENGSNDALTTATTSSFAVYKDLEGDGELFTYKEILEGWLSAFNCKITQANGRWYIYNASSLADSTTWETYDNEGTKGSDVTESIVQTVTGETAQTLIPTERDLQLNLRREAGSIECRPQNLVEREFAINGNFENGMTAWTFALSSSVDTTDGVARIVQNYASLDSVRTTPAITNTTGYAIDRQADIEVKFDWRATKIFEDSVDFIWDVYCEFDTETVDVLNVPTGWNLPNYQVTYTASFYNHLYQNPASIDKLYWDEAKGQWRVNDNQGTLITQNSSDLNEWAAVSKTFRNPTTFFNEFQQANLTNLRFFVRFYPLRSRDGKNFDGASTSRVSIELDNVSVKNMFASDQIAPVFERVQEDYTQTLSYNTIFGQSISSGLLQKINGDGFTYNGTTQTLEQIVTLQKLNDFKSRFKYYEGKFVNNTFNPLNNINKIYLNWADAGYVETASGIVNGGQFNVKRNTWSGSFYIPNQGGVLVSQYFTHNVDLVPEQFPGRSDKVVYTLALNVATVDGSANALPNGLVPDVPYIQVIGTPGDVVNDKINLLTLAGYEPVISSVVFTDTTAIPLPAQLEFGAVQEIGNNLEIPIQITLPDESEFEMLDINAECQARLDGNTDFDITWNVQASLSSDGVVIQNLGNGRGPIGGFGVLQAVITPPAGETLDATSFSTTGLPTGVNSVTYTQLGTSVLAYASVTFGATNTTATITVTGNNPTTLPSGVITSAISFDFTEMINNASTIADLTFSGVQGTRSEIILPVYAADGWELDHDNFSVTITDSGGATPSYVTMYDAIGGGENISIPIAITWPSADETINVLINGVATEVGAETVDITVNYVNNITNSSLTETSEVFTLPPGTTISYTNTLNALEGYQFATIPIGSSNNTAVVTNVATSGVGSTYNLQHSITAPDADATVTVTLTGTTEVEPYRFIVDQDTSGLIHAASNFTGVSQPFGVSDAGTTFTRLYNITGIGNYAFLNTDTLTVTSGDGVATTAPTYSGGIWSFTATFSYPTTASGFYEDPHEFYTTLTISGTPSAVDPLDTLTEVTLNFTDSVDNGTPSVPSATLTGLPGSTATYYAITVPAPGYRLAASNITTTDTSTITAIGADETRGLNVVTPITVTFPAADQAVTLVVDGDGIQIGVATNTYTLAVTTSSANVTIPDWVTNNVFTGVAGQVIEANIFIQANAGYTIDAAQLDSSAPTNVTVGVTTIHGDGAIVPISVTITGTNQTGTLDIDATTTEEPNLLTVNLSETLPLGHLTQSSFTTRFGPTDYGTTHDFGQVLITPNEGERGYEDASAAVFPTVSGLTFGTATIVDGSIAFNLSANIPANIDGDLSYTANISAGEPVRLSATTANIRSLTAGISSNGGNAVFEVVSDGLFNLSIQLSGSGVDAALSGANNDTGSFSISTTNGLLTLTGGYSPTNGISGTTLVDLEVGQEPLYLNPAGSTGLSASYFVPGPGYELIVHSRNQDGSDGAELSRASVIQSDGFGGRTYTVPNAWAANDPTLLNITTAKPNWTFYR